MPPSPARLPWVDHLRTFAIVLVVNMHACITYSHVGDWYVTFGREPTLAAKVPFIVWQGMLQSFFMGLLFFISAYFAYGSLARRGPGSFVRERLYRLGLPALLFMLAIHPLIVRGLNPWDAKFPPPLEYYARYLSSGKWLSSSGPLWFVVALLLFCLVLAACRALRRSESAAGASSTTPAKPAGRAPSARLLGAVALALGLGTFAVRLVQPIGTSVLNLQFCFFVQYIAFFVAGLHAARHGWLMSLATSRQAAAAGWWALCGSPVALLLLMFLGTRHGEAPPVFLGGPHWQALGLAAWEQASGIGLSLGMLALFSRKLNVEHPGARWLGEHSFAVYVLHTPVIIVLAMLFRGLSWNIYALIALLTVTGLAASYLAAALVRRVPFLRSIL